MTGSLSGVAVPDGTAVAAGGLGVLVGAGAMGRMRVLVASGVTPACIGGQGCRVTGNSRQLKAPEQTLSLKVVDRSPRQMTMRWSFTTSAVRQVTGEDETTSKVVKSGKVSMACASSPTQNWHCIETKLSPVLGIIDVTDMLVDVMGATVAYVAVAVDVSIPGTSPAGIVHTGVGSGLSMIPQPEPKKIKHNAPARI